MSTNQKIKVGCFALIDPFCPLDHQLQRIAEMGFHCADITDSHPGGLLGGGIFHAAVSLDDNPFDVKRMFDKHGLEISSMAAHAHCTAKLPIDALGQRAGAVLFRITADQGTGRAEVHVPDLGRE